MMKGRCAHPPQRSSPGIKIIPSPFGRGRIFESEMLLMPVQPEEELNTERMDLIERTWKR
jgi:hypothetical protein